MEIPMLHERQRKILRYLNEFGDCMTGSDLSQRLQISSRTIRSDIAEINRCIPPEIAQIQASRGSGYRLVIHNRDEFHRYISTGLNLLTREDRSRHLLIALLWATEPLNLEQLEDEMFVSRTTLEGDIRWLQSSWLTERLRFVRRKVTISLVPDEVEFRLTLLRMYSDDIDFHSRNAIIVPDGSIPHEDIQSLRAGLRDALSANGIFLDDFQFLYFSLAVWMAAARADRPLEPHDCPCSAPVKAVVAQILKKLSQVQQFPDSAEPWLCEILESTLTQPDDRSFALAQSIARENALRFDAPYLDSTFFHNMLAKFVVECRCRMAFPRFHRLDLLLELTRNYPDITQIAEALASDITQSLAVSPRCVDPRILVPGILTARSEYVSAHPEIQPVAILVCHLSSSISSYLYMRLSQHYAGRLRLIGPFPVYNKTLWQDLPGDFIISTVDMASFRALPLPAVTISPRTAPEDFQKINTMFYNLTKDRKFESKSVL